MRQRRGRRPLPGLSAAVTHRRVRRVWLLPFALAALLALSACGNGEAGAPSSGEPAVEAEVQPLGAESPEGEAEAGDTTLSLEELLAYFKSLPPAELGLEGTDLEAYYIYFGDSVVLVDGVLCVQLFLYQRESPRQANEFVGCYLLTRDASQLYRLDRGSGTVRELSL